MKINSYKIAWNTKNDEGIFILDTEDGVKRVLVDSAFEAKMMLTKLRHEGNIYFHREVVHVVEEELGFPEPVSHEYKMPEGVEIIAQQVSWVIPEKKVSTPKPVSPPIKKKEVEAKKAPVKKKKAVAKKKSSSSKRKNDKDNLRLIEGIGPKIEGLLNDAGINSFLELKSSKVDFLKAILEDAGSRYRMHDPSTWGEQAGLAAAGKMEELKVLQQKLKGGKRK